MTDWQPISTAKKDGRTILVWAKSYIGPVEAIYNTPWYRKYLPNQIKECGSYWSVVIPIIGATAFSVDGLVGFPLALNREPTHRQPLPEPPS